MNRFAEGEQELPFRAKDDEQRDQTTLKKAPRISAAVPFAKHPSLADEEQRYDAEKDIDGDRTLQQV